MLYSYLLTRSEFKINEAPETNSRDKKFAYKLYVDLLLLIMELSGYSVKNGLRHADISVDPKLAKNKVARALSLNDDIKSIILKGNSSVGVFDSILQRLESKIVHSAIFTDYAKKKNPELADDVLLWTTLLETTIGKDSELANVLREEGGFSIVGLDAAIADVCETLRSYADTRKLFEDAKKELTKSLNKGYALYLNILQLIIDITNEQVRRLEVAKSKYLASSQDLNPNTRLIDNALVAYLMGHEQFENLKKDPAYNVLPSQPGSPLVKSLLDKILESDIYKSYIESESHGLEADTEFWRDILRTVVLPSDQLTEELEDKSVYWNDDLQIMGTFALKTLRQIAQSHGREIELLPKYKDEEDERFGPELFVYAVKNQEEYRKYIDRFIHRANWDTERLAYMDIIIMTAAIAEIINYPLIPIPVSVNEYVEIANNYSTDKSGGFVNGILYSITKYLLNEGIINK